MFSDCKYFQINHDHTHRPGCWGPGHWHGTWGAQCQLCCFLVVVQGDCLCWSLILCPALCHNCVSCHLPPLVTPVLVTCWCSLDVSDIVSVSLSVSVMTHSQQSPDIDTSIKNHLTVYSQLASFNVMGWDNFLKSFILKTHFCD